MDQLYLIRPALTRAGPERYTLYVPQRPRMPRDFMC